MTMRLTVAAGLIACAILGGNVAVYAFPTDGVVAPVPEVLPDKTYEVQVEHHGVQVMQGRAYRERIGLQIGLGDRWEIGFDHHLGSPDRVIDNYADYRWHLKYDPQVEGYDKHWFNFKTQILIETEDRPALTWGVVNISGNSGSGNYLVAGKHFGPWQFCLGWSDMLDNPPLSCESGYVYEILGYQCNEDWKFWLEHISRGGFSTNVAVEGRIADGLYLTAGWMRPNNVLYDDDWILNLTYRGTWE